MVLETGQGVVGATSYVSVAQADASISITAWSVLSVGEKEALLEQASEYIDLRYGPRFAGTRYTQSQGLDWPREKVGLPLELIKAVILTAELLTTGTDVYEALAEGSIRSESVSLGEMSESIEYVGSKPTLKSFPKINLLMRRLCASTATIERA